MCLSYWEAYVLLAVNASGFFFEEVGPFFNPPFAMRCLLNLDVSGAAGMGKLI